MKHLIIACLIAAILLAAAGCSGSEAPSGAASYLTVSNSKAAFIRWRSAPHGHLEGTITENRIGGSAPARTVSASSARFTGTMTGKSVRLTFKAWYFLHTRARGTLSGNVLTMWVPQSDGTSRQVRFTQADETAYHRAVAALHRRARHANLAAKQHAKQGQKPAHAQAQRNSQKALATVYRTSSLAPGGILAHGLARFADDVHAARAHLATEKKDASRNDKYCGAAFSVGGDAQAVDGALQSVQGDVVSLQADLLAIRHDIATATALLRHLRKAGVTVPNSASDVIASAKVNLKHAVAKANSYIDQVNAADARARTIANRLATRACSGARYGSSVRPVPHIR